MNQKTKIILLVEVIVLFLLLILFVCLMQNKSEDPNESTGPSYTQNPAGTTDNDGTMQGTVGNSFGSTEGDSEDVDSVTTAPTSGATTPSTRPSEPIIQPSSPSIRPSEGTKPTEPSGQTTPATQPTGPSQGTEPAMDYKTYMGLTAQEQKAYRETFDTISDFFAWYNAAKKEYEDQKTEIDVGNGSIDLEDIMGGKNK